MTAGVLVSYTLHSSWLWQSTSDLKAETELCGDLGVVFCYLGSSSGLWLVTLYEEGPEIEHRIICTSDIHVHI